MIKQHFLFFATCMIMGMSACTHEEEMAEVNTLPTDNVIRVTTGVTPNVTSTVTRAGYETSNLNEFGFFVNNPVSDIYTYNNVKMIKAEGEIWKSSTEAEMYWMSRLQPVTVLAYAPYKEEAYTVSSKFAVGVKHNQSARQDVLDSDLIGMKKENFMPKIGEGGDLTGDGFVSISMQHLMSKIRLSIEYPGKLNSSDGLNPVSGVKIDGIATNGFCDFGAWNGDDLSSVVTVNSEAPNIETITPFSEDFSQETDGGTAIYECIVMPQACPITIYFTIGGVPYSWIWESLELKPGNLHKINLKIVGRKVELSTNVSVDDWLDDDKNDITITDDMQDIE